MVTALEHAYIAPQLHLRVAICSQLALNRLGLPAGSGLANVYLGPRDAHNQ
jgi:hypothetical protein